MESHKSNRLFLVLLFAFLASGTVSIPTLSNREKRFPTCNLPATSYAHNLLAPQTNHITEPTNPQQARIPAEFLKPSASFTGSGYACKNIGTPKLAIIRDQYDVDLILKQLGTGTEQHVYFVPLCIFTQLTRKPLINIA